MKLNNIILAVVIASALLLPGCSQKVPDPGSATMINSQSINLD